MLVHFRRITNHIANKSKQIIARPHHCHMHSPWNEFKNSKPPNPARATIPVLGRRPRHVTVQRLRKGLQG